MAARSIAHSERTSSTMIDRGLYVLRYVSTGSVGTPPMVHVRPSFGSEGVVHLVSAPGAVAGALSGPGTALVIKVEASAKLQITLQSSGNDAPEAELKLEPIDNVARTRDQTSGYVPDFGPHRDEGLKLFAHVSRRGDVSAAPGQWIAGPSAPSPIEGIAAVWRSGRGQGLEYQVIMQGTQSWSDWVGAGTFLGTRGDARALVGVRFRLTSESDHTLKASALFLGSAAMEVSGQTVELRSAAGYDPLVGLSLDILAAPRPAPAPAYVDPPPVQPERRGRVRVFRAGGEQV